PTSIPEPMPFASGVALAAQGTDLRTGELQATPEDRAARAALYAQLAAASSQTNQAEASGARGSIGGGFSRTGMGAPPPRARPASFDLVEVAPTSARTGGGLVLAFYPWITTIAGFVLIAQALMTPGVLALPLFVGALLIGLLFFAAARDRAKLRDLGF